MITFVFGVVLGAVVAFSVDEPAIVKSTREKVFSSVKGAVSKIL